MGGKQASGAIIASLGSQGLESHEYQKPCLKMVKSKYNAHISPGQGTLLVETLVCDFFSTFHS